MPDRKTPLHQVPVENVSMHNKFGDWAPLGSPVEPQRNGECLEKTAGTLGITVPVAENLGIIKSKEDYR